MGQCYLFNGTQGSFRKQVKISHESEGQGTGRECVGRNEVTTGTVWCY